jgi:hypothetical protein
MTSRLPIFRHFRRPLTPFADFRHVASRHASATPPLAPLTPRHCLPLTSIIFADTRRRLFFSPSASAFSFRHDVCFRYARFVTPMPSPTLSLIVLPKLNIG